MVLNYETFGSMQEMNIIGLIKHLCDPIKVHATELSAVDYYFSQYSHQFIEIIHFPSDRDSHSVIWESTCSNILVQETLQVLVQFRTCTSQHLSK